MKDSERNGGAVPSEARRGLVVRAMRLGHDRLHPQRQRQRDNRFDGTSLLSLLKHLLNVEGGAVA